MFDDHDSTFRNGLLDRLVEVVELLDGSGLGGSGPRLTVLPVGLGNNLNIVGQPDHNPRANSDGLTHTRAPTWQ